MKIPATKRVKLRPWHLTDAPALYKSAQQPNIGPRAGWAPHQDVKQSKNTIATLFKQTRTYAITLIPTDQPVGSLSLKIGSQSELCLNEQHGEIGYWIACEYWGKGLVVEATQALLRVCFEQENFQVIWCSYFCDNVASKRVAQKLGFTFVCTKENQYFPLIDQYKTLEVVCITQKQWLQQL